MTPLRRKMIEELQIRHFAPSTQKNYLSLVAQFARHYGRSPEQLGLKEVRAYLCYLVNDAKFPKGFQPATLGLPSPSPLPLQWERNHAVLTLPSPTEVGEE